VTDDKVDFDGYSSSGLGQEGAESVKDKMIVMIVVLLGLAAEPQAYAGETTGFCISPGVGVGGAGSEMGLAYGVNASWTIRGTVISARAIGCRNLDWFGPDLSSSDYSILTGARIWNGSEQASLEGGLGYVQITDKGRLLETGFFFNSYEKVRRSALGLALQARYLYRGVGFVIYGNVNSARTFGGFMLCFRFGRW
jgi:hypothetical protein